MEELLKKLLLLKTNPKLIESLPQADIIKMMDVLVKSFRALQKAIEENKLKGDDGYTPVPGKDYPTLEQVSRSLEGELSRYEKRFSSLETTLAKKLSALRDGKDAVVTKSQIEEAARLASQLVKLPDFSTALAEVQSVNADSIVMLQDAFERLDKEIEDLKKIPRGQDHVIKRLRYMADVDVSTTKPNENATIQYQTATGKWLTGVSITVSQTAPTDPKFGDIWIAIPG